jgi:tetratricopeptide (TPR) repeat protein
MLTGLIAVSLLPLVSSVIQASSSANAPAANLPAQAASRLEAEVMGYELVLEREPDNSNAWQGLLEARLRQGNIADAIAPLEKLTQLNPESLDYGLLLAQTQQYLKNYAGAMTTYQGLLAAHPGDVQVLKGMVDSLIEQQRPQEAVQLVQTVLAQAEGSLVNGSNGSLVNNVTSLQLLLGEIYGQQDRYGEAIAIYDRAIKDNASDFRPLLAKALLFQTKGKVKEAEPLFTTAIQLAPPQYKDEIKKLVVKPSLTPPKPADSFVVPPAKPSSP